MTTSKLGIFSSISGDLFGGLTAGIVALPLALAFGAETELGAAAGLYGAIALGMLAAIFGGTLTQISGPTAPMTAVSAVVISKTIDQLGSLETALPVILATFVVAGLIQVLMGVLKLGRYIKFIPYPVISGFMSGIGVIILIGQIFPFFGASAPDGKSLQTLKALRQLPEVANIWSIALALGTIAIIYFGPKVLRSVPGPLQALIIITLFALFLVPEGAITTLGSGGEGLGGLPSFQFDLFGALTDFANIGIILEYGATLAALGAIDSLLTSIVADNITRTKHDSNRELIGQGIGNIGAALIGGLPGAGATIRTVVNVNAGGRTRLSGVIAASVLLLMLVGLGSLMGYIPNPVLAGILITVGIGIIDYRGLKHLFKVSRADAVVLVTVLVLTVVVDLLIAVAVGMVLASLLFMKKASEIAEDAAKASTLTDMLQTHPWADEDSNFVKKFGNRLYIKRLEGALFFGFTAKFRELLAAVPEVDVVIIRLSRVPYIDQSGLYALEDAILDLETRGVQVILTGINEQPRAMMKSVGILGGLVASEQIFDNFRDAYAYLEDKFAKGDLTPKRTPLLPGDIREL